MTCQELVELVTSYLEGALPVPEQRAFEEHLALCAGCDRYLDQLRRTIELLGAVPDDALSEPAVQQLSQAFAEWSHPAPPDAIRAAPPPRPRP
jgi:anti-sigma factor RsiW